DFAKTVLDWHRQQAVAPNLNLAVHFTGQTANRNLDSSEKLFLGGADGVRAFPQGEASGDEGYLISGELQWLLPGLSDSKNTVSLAGFYDYGSVMVNKHPWAGAGDNRRSLMGAGLGIRWAHSREYALRLDYAWKIGDEAATSGSDKTGRLWLQGIRYF
ncbi:MAG: ShlB/FhaC/HecB family hemolysin secretion/activation protein, partial [Veillonellales bacterium]